MKIYLKLIRHVKLSWTIVGEMVGGSSSSRESRLMVKKCFGCVSRWLDVDVFKTLKMDIVLDIQCITHYKNREIPKEVVVLSSIAKPSRSGLAWSRCFRKSLVQKRRRNFEKSKKYLKNSGQQSAHIFRPPLNLLFILLAWGPIRTMSWPFFALSFSFMFVVWKC